MGLLLDTAPAVEPIDTATAKAHLRITASDDDDYIDGLAKTARIRAESFIGRALITQTWDWVLDAFPVWFAVPKPPLISVGSIAYIDDAGDNQTLDSSLYTVDAISRPGRITPSFGNTWPATRAEMNAVTVQFTAGYGVAGSDVPDDILHAMLILISELYEHREDAVVGAGVNSFPVGFKTLLWPYKMPAFG